MISTHGHGLKLSSSGPAAPGQFPRVRLPAAIARQAHLHDDQTVKLSVVAEGVLIRAVSPRPSLAERLTSDVPLAADPVEALAWEPVGAETIAIEPLA